MAVLLSVVMLVAVPGMIRAGATEIPSSPPPARGPTPAPEPVGWREALKPPPSLKWTVPAPHMAPLASVIRMEFSDPMDAERVEGSFHIHPPVEGTFEWPDFKTAAFHPKALNERTTYRVSVGGTSLEGRRLDGQRSFEFTTAYPPAAVPHPFTLTFDDCGTPEQIQGILSALADRELKAIFFPTGVCRDIYPWLVPALLSGGHRVCNHTYSHANLTRLSDVAVRSEIARGVSAECDLFRPPYGALDSSGRIARVASSLGYRVQLWDVDTRDWAGTGADTMVAMIRARGGIVLMHLHGLHTAEAIRGL
jgi:peptidoglycan-N-acetylglucosamine deacetylase